MSSTLDIVGGSSSRFGRTEVPGLVMTNVAIEHGHRTSGWLPSKKMGGSFHSFLLTFTRGYHESCFFSGPKHKMAMDQNRWTYLKLVVTPSESQLEKSWWTPGTHGVLSHARRKSNRMMKLVFFGDLASKSTEISMENHGFLEVQNFRCTLEKVLGKNQLLFIWRFPKDFSDLPTSSIHCSWNIWFDSGKHLEDL